MPIAGGNYIVIAMRPAKAGNTGYILKILLMLASLSSLSCSLLEKKPAALWTDSPELLIAAEMFNAQKQGHLLEVHYFEQISQELGRAVEAKKPLPSLVIGRGLRSPQLAQQFRPLDYLFGDEVFSRNSFYPGLLDAGMRDGKQIYLPLSFNLMLILSPKNSAAAQSLKGLEPPLPQGCISLEEIKRRSLLGKEVISKKTGFMGFSPRWPDEDFLFHWVQLRGADFHEPESAELKGKSNGSRILTWSEEALAQALEEFRDYTAMVNGSAAEEDSFYFSHLFAPGYKNIESGRILYSAMDSTEFFALPPATRVKFDFHYLADQDRLAVLEGIRYAGIPRRARARASAEAFLAWFFTPENQQAVLEASRSLRLSETSFGIAGGFSSLRIVTEEIFPGFYGDLENRLPPADSVRAPKPLPTAWEGLYREMLLPWLKHEAAQAPGSAVKESLNFALASYLDRNPTIR